MSINFLFRDQQDLKFFYCSVVIWDKQSFVFLDSPAGSAGFSHRAISTAPARGESRGKGLLPFSLSQVVATVKKTKRLSWWNLPCPSVFIPVLFSVCLFTFLFKLLF